MIYIKPIFTFHVVNYELNWKCVMLENWIKTHELFIFKPNIQINNLRMLKIKIKMQKKGKERTKRYKMQPNEMWLEKKTPERNKQKREKNEW